MRSTARKLIWEPDLSAAPGWKASVIWVVRMVYVLIRDMFDGQLTLRAMSLVFTTFLSLVPLLAVSFSVLKAFGVHNHVEPALLRFLEPLGEKGAEITNNMIGFVDNIRVGLLGSVGIALLFYTVISLIQKVEAAFNYAWRVERTRSWSKRFSSYLSVIMVGPVLVFAAIGITASLMSSSIVQTIVAIEPFGSLFRLAGLLAPFLLIIAAFTFFYVFIPNTRVELGAALTGGLLAGVLWNITGKLFATFVVQSAKYTAIYSGFAIIFFFMIWVYLSWLIMLVGASVAFYRQHPQYVIAERHATDLSIRIQERLSLLIMALVGQHFYQARPAWSVDTLSQRLNVSAEAISHLVGTLEQGGLLSATEGEPPQYLPARPLEETSVQHVLDVVRSANEGFRLHVEPLASIDEVNKVIDDIDAAVHTLLEGKTLKDLAVSESSSPVVSSIESYQHNTASAAPHSDQ